MYILISISGNDYRSPSKVSKRKSKLVEHIKEHGYYFSKKLNRYIDDKNTKDGGSGVDYVIEQIEEI